MTEAQKVGFIGLGNMGGRMTRCIVDGGREVLGFDMLASNIENSGATAASDAAQVARDSDVILMSLPDSKVVEKVVLGDEGFI